MNTIERVPWHNNGAIYRLKKGNEILYELSIDHPVTIEQEEKILNKLNAPAQERWKWPTITPPGSTLEDWLAAI